MKNTDAHVKRPAISYYGGLKRRHGVTARVRTKLQYASCQRVIIYLVNDRGTHDTTDDLIHEVEFGDCIPQWVIKKRYIKSETILESLEQYDLYKEVKSVEESPLQLALIIEDMFSTFIADQAKLEIDQRPVDREKEVVVVTLQLGCFSAFAELTLDEARPFFEIKEEHYGDPIIGEPVDDPIAEINDDEMDITSEVANFR